jgi:hypothetical protein
MAKEGVHLAQGDRIMPTREARQQPHYLRVLNAFLLQLDSGLPIADEREHRWAWGGGLGYGFWCDGCRVSAWRWQCT